MEGHTTKALDRTGHSGQFGSEDAAARCSRAIHYGMPRTRSTNTRLAKRNCLHMPPACQRHTRALHTHTCHTHACCCLLLPSCALPACLQPLAYTPHSISSFHSPAAWQQSDLPPSTPIPPLSLTGRAEHLRGGSGRAGGAVRRAPLPTPWATHCWRGGV